MKLCNLTLLLTSIYCLEKQDHGSKGHYEFIIEASIFSQGNQIVNLVQHIT